MTLRQEIHGFIDDISESKLKALKPLLIALADDSIVIETDLTDEEHQIIARGTAEYEKAPETFIPLENIN